MGAKTSVVILALLSVVLGFIQMGDRVSLVPDDKVIRLNFWNGFTGPDGRTMLHIIREFNEDYPNIEVTMQRMEWSIYFNKLMVAGIDGRGPEVFILHASEMPRFQRAGFMATLDEVYEGEDALPVDDFDPNLLKQMRYDGHMIGVPMDIHPQGLFYNAKMFREAGIVDENGVAKPPTNREEFMDAVRKLRIDKNGDGRPEQWGFALTMWRNNFTSLLPQFGGNYFDESGQCAIDSPESIAALEFMVSLGGDDPLVPAPENNLGWVGFRQKKVAMVFEGIYMLGDLKRLEGVDRQLERLKRMGGDPKQIIELEKQVQRLHELESELEQLKGSDGDPNRLKELEIEVDRLKGLQYMAAPMPVIGKQHGTHGDSHILCLQKDLDPEVHEAAIAFLKFISNHDIQWADAGQVPARNSAREAEVFKDMQVQYAFSHQIPYVNYPPRSPAVFELQQQIDFAVEKALRRRATAEEALKTARKNFEDFVRKAELPMLMEEEAK